MQNAARLDKLWRNYILFNAIFCIMSFKVRERNEVSDLTNQSGGGRSPAPLFLRLCNSCIVQIQLARKLFYGVNNSKIVKSCRHFCSFSDKNDTSPEEASLKDCDRSWGCPLRYRGLGSWSHYRVSRWSIRQKISETKTRYEKRFSAGYE